MPKFLISHKSYMKYIILVWLINIMGLIHLNIICATKNSYNNNNKSNNIANIYVVKKLHNRKNISIKIEESV